MDFLCVQFQFTTKQIVQTIRDSKENSLDLFIENAFKDSVEKRFKTYFLKYIGKSLLGEFK